MFCDTAVGSFTNLRNDNLDGLRNILEGSYDELLNSARGSSKNDEGFINPSQMDKDRDNFNKIKSYYESCMDENAIEVLGPTPIYPEITSLLGKLGFSSEVTDTRFTNDNLRQFTDTLIHLGTTGVDNLISYSIGPDDQNPEENSISFNQPSLGLPSREYYEKPAVIAEYRAGLIALVTAVLGEPKTTSPLDEIRRVKLVEHNLMPLAEFDVESMVDRFVDFETRLAKLTLPK